MNIIIKAIFIWNSNNNRNVFALICQFAIRQRWRSNKKTTPTVFRNCTKIHSSHWTSAVLLNFFFSHITFNFWEFWTAFRLKDKNFLDISLVWSDLLRRVFFWRRPFSYLLNLSLAFCFKRWMADSMPKIKTKNSNFSNF